MAEPSENTSLTLSPRGKQQNEDSTKFGQRMLEKMGWRQGKGLGAKEQGITSHIAVNLKNDNQGVGFSQKDNDWCKHQEQFEEVLANLSESMGSTGGDDPPKSLEETSKTSKARIHYTKLTRGKDLSQYSKKDLDCILGHKAKSAEKPSTSCIGGDIGSVDNSFGVATIVGGNMMDYLKKKYSSSSSAENLNKVEKKRKKRNRSGSEEAHDVLEIKGKRKKTMHRRGEKCKLADNERESNERPGDSMCLDENSILPDLKLGRKGKKQKKKGRKESCLTSSESSRENFADDENSETLSLEMQDSHEDEVEIFKKKGKSKSADPTHKKLCEEITLSDTESNESAVRVESCVGKLGKKKKKIVGLDSVTNNPLGNRCLVNDKNKSCRQDMVDSSKGKISKSRKKNPKNIIIIDLASQEGNLKVEEDSKSKDEMMGLQGKVPDEHVKCEDLTIEPEIITNSEIDQVEEPPICSSLSDDPEILIVEDKMEVNIIVDLSSKENVDIVKEKKIKMAPKKTMIVDIATSESSGMSTEGTGVSCSALPKKLKKKTKQTVNLTSNVYSDVALVDLGDSEGCNDLSLKNDRDRLDAGCLKESRSSFVTIDLTNCDDGVSGPVRNRKVDSKNSEEISQFHCLRKKESNDTSVSESIELFCGVNLGDIKGYGDK